MAGVWGWSTGHLSIAVSLLTPSIIDPRCEVTLETNRYRQWGHCPLARAGLQHTFLQPTSEIIVRAVSVSC